MPEAFIKGRKLATKSRCGPAQTLPSLIRSLCSYIISCPARDQPRHLPDARVLLPASPLPLLPARSMLSCPMARLFSLEPSPVGLSPSAPLKPLVQGPCGFPAVEHPRLRGPICSGAWRSMTPRWRKTFGFLACFSVFFAGYPASHQLPHMGAFQDPVHGPLLFCMGMTWDLGGFHQAHMAE